MADLHGPITGPDYADLEEMGIKTRTRETADMVAAAIALSQALSLHQSGLDQLERHGPGVIEPEEVGLRWALVLRRVKSWRGSWIAYQANGRWPD